MCRYAPQVRGEKAWLCVGVRCACQSARSWRNPTKPLKYVSWYVVPAGVVEVLTGRQHMALQSPGASVPKVGASLCRLGPCLSVLAHAARAAEGRSLPARRSGRGALGMTKLGVAPVPRRYLWEVTWRTENEPHGCPLSGLTVSANQAPEGAVPPRALPSGTCFGFGVLSSTFCTRTEATPRQAHDAGTVVISRPIPAAVGILRGALGCRAWALVAECPYLRHPGGPRRCPF